MSFTGKLVEFLCIVFVVFFPGSFGRDVLAWLGYTGVHAGAINFCATVAIVLLWVTVGRWGVHRLFGHLPSGDAVVSPEKSGRMGKGE